MSMAVEGGSLSGVPAAGPATGTAGDGAVEVAIDADGTPVEIRLAPDWQKKVPVRQLKDAVIEAHAEARTAQVADMLARVSRDALVQAASQMATERPVGAPLGNDVGARSQDMRAAMRATREQMAAVAKQDFTNPGAFNRVTAHVSGSLVITDIEFAKGFAEQYSPKDVARDLTRAVVTAYTAAVQARQAVVDRCGVVHAVENVRAALGIRQG